MPNSKGELTRQQYNEHVPAIRLGREELVSDVEIAATREAPYFLRGRDSEIVTLAREVLKMPKPVRLITGPPGSGKSSLLTYMKVYAELLGFETCKIQSADWASNDLLAKRINPTAATVRGTSTGAQAGVNFGPVSAGGDKEWTEAELPILSVIDAINQRAAKSPKGLLVLIDEFQNLALKSDEVKAQARDVLDYFHSSVPQGDVRDETGRPVRTMCLGAGLLDSLDTAEKLGLTRITDSDCIRLAHISPAASQQVIRDHLEVKPEGKVVLATATDEQIRRVVETTEGYTHHLSTAAQLLQAKAETAKFEGRTALTDDDVASVVEESNNAKRTLYKRRVNALDEGKEFMAVAMAELAEAWPTGVPPKVITRAIIRIRDGLHRLGDTVTQSELERRLQRAGVIEKRDSTDRFPAAVTPDGRSLDAHWTIPIPSLRTYILENCDDYERPPNFDLDLSDLTSDGAKREYAAPQPWEWRDHAPSLAARKLPRVKKSKLVAWVKERMALLGDRPD